VRLPALRGEDTWIVLDRLKGRFICSLTTSQARIFWQDTGVDKESGMPNQQAAFQGFVAEFPRNDRVLRMSWKLSPEDPKTKVKFTSAHLPESGGSVPLPVKRMARQLVDQRMFLGEALRLLDVATRECGGVNVEFSVPKGQKRVLMRVSDGNGNEPIFLTLFQFEKVSTD